MPILGAAREAVPRADAQAGADTARTPSFTAPRLTILVILFRTSLVTLLCSCLFITERINLTFVPLHP